ncbi:MAG: helix-turn-helix domain-containing protein [Thermoactinospora sp.]|nr:helix-turn-helix domain-containing protein [Thermoactinospora sp.]
MQPHPESPAYGTVPPYLLRLTVDAARAAGVREESLARVPGLESIAEDGIRLPSVMALRLWEVAGAAIEGWGGGARVAQLWTPGRLNVWDYLFRSAPTLAEGLRVASRLLPAVRDPLEGAQVTEDGSELVTVTYRTPYGGMPGASHVSELALGLILQEARAATGRPIVPSRVLLPHQAPRDHRHLAEIFGTREIGFGAGRTAIVFGAADASAPLPGADPTLSAIVQGYAETAIASARPVLGWLDKVHGEVAAAFREGTPTLAGVAHRLAMSPRTLQRRLGEEGTTWREELERVRHAESARLLRETSLGIESIAARVGYQDVRALRRAFQRIHGHPPSLYRRRHAA